MLAAIGVLAPEVLCRLSIYGMPGQHWWNTAIDWAPPVRPAITTHKP
jgi:hypothetical protein